jgi:hypothetical protein
VGYVDQRLTGREHHLAALEQIRQVGQIADVHPSHRPVQGFGPVCPAHDLGLAGLQHRQPQNLANGWQH